MQGWRVYKYKVGNGPQVSFCQDVRAWGAPHVTDVAPGKEITRGHAFATLIAHRSSWECLPTPHPPRPVPPCEQVGNISVSHLKQMLPGMCSCPESEKQAEPFRRLTSHLPAQTLESSPRICCQCLPLFYPLGPHLERT